MVFKPDFIRFACYGTLVNFEIGPAARRLFEDDEGHWLTDFRQLAALVRL